MRQGGLPSWAGFTGLPGRLVDLAAWILADVLFVPALDQVVPESRLFQKTDSIEHADMSESHPAIGIDLGTTFSAVARLDETGRPTTLANVEGDKTTPSVLFFDGDEVIVGKEAVKAMGDEMPCVADCVKRELGQRIYSKELAGRQYPPAALQAWVLHKLGQDTRTQVGPFHKVVVTVPAYFDEAHRKATQDAGYMAGFDVMDIINEPTAAAVAFGYQQGYITAHEGVLQSQNILVYDLGGGTFDVTVMEIGDREFRALATDGDVHLGGQDWDRRLVDFVAEEFMTRFAADPRQHPNSLGRLWRESEDAKRTLSARSKATILCEHGGHSLRVEVTRGQFEDLTRDLLDRTAFTTRETLQAAGLAWSDVDRVLLVGGSTRMPAIGVMLKELSGREPDRTVSPDEAVAHGAALHAGVLLARHAGKSPSFKIANVNSHSLGVAATDRKTGRPRTATLIPRNTRLPVTAKRIFHTQKQNQKSILVQIVEGENAIPDACSQVGRCSIRSLPDELAARTPVEVCFRYLENGRLTVYVAIEGIEKRVKHELLRENSLSQEALDSWRKYISGLSPMLSRESR